jgi:hypothetical protein
MWFRKKIRLEDKFTPCAKCGGLFREYRMSREEVIRRPKKAPRAPYFHPYVDYDYYCIHCQRLKEEDKKYDEAITR